MADDFDLLWLRVPPIRYVSPPACLEESSGSGSSGPILVVEHPARFKVTGLRVEDCVLHWDALPSGCAGSCAPVLCYNVYRTETGGNVYSVFAECVNVTEFSVSDNACYRVSAITTEGESDLSDVVCVECGI